VRIGVAEDVSTMRLPRLRFTVRRLMAVVALAGVVMGAGVWSERMWRLSRVYALESRREEVLGDICRMLEAQCRSHLERYKPSEPIIWPARAAMRKVLDEESAGVARFESQADYHSLRARKYERAARYPWLPVESDPPEP
jgi:hypothetical protein